QVEAVDLGGLVAVEPRALVHVGPAAHRVQGGREGLPLQVAHVALGGAAEDAVDVTGGERQPGVAGTGQRGDLPANRVEVASVVPGPLHPAALRTGPSLD